MTEIPEHLRKRSEDARRRRDAGPDWLTPKPEPVYPGPPRPRPGPELQSATFWSKFGDAMEDSAAVVIFVVVSGFALFGLVVLVGSWLLAHGFGIPSGAVLVGAFALWARWTYRKVMDRE